MKSHLMMMSAALMVTSIAVATNVPSQELTSTFGEMVYDLDNDLTVPGDGDVVDVAIEGFHVTLTPDNFDCGDAMWPTIPGNGDTPVGCGMVTYGDGTTGLYVATDGSGGSARARNNLWIETVDGDIARFKRLGTGCEASEYRFETFKQLVQVRDGVVQAIGTGALCFDAARWDL